MNLSELFKRTPLALIVLGILLLIVAAVGGLPIGNQPLLITEPIWRVILAVAGAVLLVIGLLLLLRENSRRENYANRNDSTQQSPSFFISNKELEALDPIVDVIGQSQDLLLAGVALGYAAQRHRAQLLKQIEKGAKLRFMVLDPTSPDIDAMAKVFEVPPDQIRDDIGVTLRDLDVLKTKAKSIRPGSVEVRLLLREPPYSFALSNPQGPSGRFSAGIRAYGHRSTTRPYFILMPTDKWFRFFVESCESLWADSPVWPRSVETTKPVLQKAGVVPYRIVGDGKPEVLLITARTNPQKWIFPVGAVDPGETLPQAAARECAEESGFSVDIGPKLGMIEIGEGGSISRMTFFIARVVGETKIYETDRQRKWIQLSELMQSVTEDFLPFARAALEKLAVY